MKSMFCKWFVVIVIVTLQGVSVHTKSLGSSERDPQRELFELIEGEKLLQNSEEEEQQQLSTVDNSLKLHSELELTEEKKAAGLTSAKRVRTKKDVTPSESASSSLSSSTSASLSSSPSGSTTSTSSISNGPSASGTASSTVSPSVSSSASLTPTSSVSFSSTRTPSPSVTSSKTATASPSISPVPSSSPSASSSSSISVSPIASTSESSSISPTKSFSRTSSNSVSFSSSTSYSPSKSISSGPTDSNSISLSPSFSFSSSISISPTISFSSSVSPISSVSPSVSNSPTISITSSPSKSASTSSSPYVPKKNEPNRTQPEHIPFKPHPMEKVLYDKELNSKWNYNMSDSARGPQRWTQADGSFGLCGETFSQSPIDLFSFHISSPNSPLLTPQYKPGKLLIRNTGNYIRLIPNTGSVLYFGEKVFDLVYLQVHSPSEHRINGEIFPVEIQFMHKSQDNPSEYSAISLLYKRGIQNNFLERVLESADNEKNSEDFMIGGSINLAEVIPTDLAQYKSGTRVNYPYYSYEGSSTIPPCFENVRWFVWAKPDQVSNTQIESIRKLVQFPSNRPLQEQGERIVEFKSLF